MHYRAMVAALVSCGLLLILTLPLGSSASAVAAPPQPAVGHGDPSLPHSPQMLQMLAKGGRGAGPQTGRGAANAQGIDIASYQHPNGAGIDWGQVAGAGYKFAYIKATEGNYYQNPYYGGDAAGAGGAGMFRGAYHFAIPNGADGATQADYLLNSTGYANDGLTLPPMLDMEWDPYSGDACYGLNASQMVGWIAAFGGEVQRRIGRPPVIYTAASWWNQCTGGTSAFSAYPLAIASWGSGSPETPGWSTWTFWQTTSGAGVPGVNGPVDADVFTGDVDALGAFVRGGASPATSAKPQIVSWGHNRLDVFVRGTDNGLWHRAWDGAGWWPAGGWEPLGGQMTSDPAVVSWGAGRLDVFARGGDSSLWHVAWDGTGWSGWQPLGGQLIGVPAAVSWGPGRLDVFGRGTDNGLWHAGWDGSGWTGWQRLGGLLTSNISAVSWGANRLDIFAQGGDRGLWHTAWDGTGWSGWQSLGGQLTGDPAASSWGTGRLDVIVRGADNAVWHKAWDGARWWPGNWQPLGGLLSGDPTVVSWGPGRLDILGRGGDSALWHKAWDGAQWWPDGGWQPLGGLLSSGPDAASWGPGRIDAVVGGTDRSVWHNGWDGTGWWWGSLGGQLGSLSSGPSQ